MPTYYVTAPGSQLTAEVDAPDSRHARTTFLDYLSRSRLIPWGARQTVRKQLMTKKIQPGSISTSVQLSYNAKETAPEVVTVEPQSQYRPDGDYIEETGPQGERRLIKPEDEGYAEAKRQVVQPQTVAVGNQPVNPMRRSVLGNSPIANLSRNSRGM